MEYSIGNTGTSQLPNMPHPIIHKPNLEAIGDRVRKLRGSILQNQLAVELGISQGQLSKIESGRVAPTLEVLVGLADRFKISIDWIARGEHFPASKKMMTLGPG